jgi:hypothetical protein
MCKAKSWFAKVTKPLLVTLALISFTLIPVSLVLALHAVPMENMAVALGADVSVGRTFQRDTFYGAGRAWVFYMGYDALLATHMYFRSSTDGVNWQPRSLFCDVTDADEFSLHWDGTYVHVTWVCNDASQAGVTYRRGTPNSNGTITWSAAQAVYIPSVVSGYVLPTVTVYDGRPYIAYGHLSGPTQVWGATSSNQTNGTWVPDVLFENANLTAGNATISACIDALASGVIHVALESIAPPDAFSEVGSVRYTAGGWQPYETIIDTGAFGDWLCSTVPWGNIINVITNFAPGNDISHRQSSIGGMWAIAPASTVISLNSYIHATVSIWDNADGDLKCFFSDGLPADISWKHYDNALGTWDAAFIPLVTAHADKLNSAQIHSSPLGVVYEDDLAPDSDIVYYDYLDSFPPTTSVFATASPLVAAMVIIIILTLVALTLMLLLSQRSMNDLIYVAILGVIAVIICMTLWVNS